MADYLQPLPGGSAAGGAADSAAAETVQPSDYNRLVRVLNGTAGTVGANFFAANPPLTLSEPAMVPGVNRNEHIVQRGEQGVASFTDLNPGAGVDGGTLINTVMACGVPPSHTIYGVAGATPNQFLSMVDGGSTTNLFLFPVGEIVTCVCVLSTGTIIAATTDAQNVGSPSTFLYVYRSTDNGSTFTKVASSAAVIGSSVQLVVGPYMNQFSMANNGTATCAGVYGYRAGSLARYVYRSADDGVTWAIALDLGANASGHVHQVYADPYTNHFWVTQGDVPGRRAVNVSTDNGLTWTANTFLDTDGTTQLQFLAIVAYRGWIYMGEDNDARGRIVRFKESNISGTFEVVYDPDLDGITVTLAGAAGSSPFVAPIFGLGVDKPYNVLWVYAPGESAAPYTNHGRFMISPDGINFMTLWETGAGLAPQAGLFTFQDFTGGNYLYHSGGLRFRRRVPYRTAGMRPVDQMTLTFSIPGAVATQVEAFAISSAAMGFSFRVVRAGFFIQTAQTGGTMTMDLLRAAAGGSQLSMAKTLASVAAGAVGNARYADVALSNSNSTSGAALTRLTPETTDYLTVNITNNGTGGTGLSGFIVIEKIAGPVLVKYP